MMGGEASRPRGGRGGGEGIRTRDHLANTRTLLAWLRLCVVLIGAGFVITKLATLESGAASDRPWGLAVTGLAVIVGAGAALRFLAQRSAIESDVFSVHYRTDLILALGAAASGALVMIFIGLTR